MIHANQLAMQERRANREEERKLARAKADNAAGREQTEPAKEQTKQRPDEKAKKKALLDAYHAKKAKKPVLIAKSSLMLDVKPWDDETDMVRIEEHVRSIQCDGLVWGQSKLVPLAYGIKKLSICAVIEDDKVSTDWLDERITEFDECVQSMDIAKFNKI